MHANARVLLFSDQNDSGDLAGKLEQRGYQPLPANSREDALRIVTGRFPDIAIVNAATNGEGARFRQDLSQLSPDSSIPTIVIGFADDNSDDNLQVEYLPTAFRDSELFSRLKTLARLVTCKGNWRFARRHHNFMGLKHRSRQSRPSISVTPESWLSPPMRTGNLKSEK